MPITLGLSCSIGAACGLPGRPANTASLTTRPCSSSSRNQPVTQVGEYELISTSVAVAGSRQRHGHWLPECPFGHDQESGSALRENLGIFRWSSLVGLTITSKWTRFWFTSVFLADARFLHNGETITHVVYRSGNKSVPLEHLRPNPRARLRIYDGDE